MNTILGLLAVCLLIFMNGFFVAAEFSLVGARRTRIAQLADEGSAGAKSAQDAMNHLDSYIAATQLGITLASLALGWIGEPAIAHLFEPILHLLLPEEMLETVGHTISIAIAFALVTMFHIIFGELAPKSIALQRPESTAIVIARPTTWFLRIFRPVIALMNAIGNAVVKALGFEPAGEHAQIHSAEELEMLVHSSREAGLLQESEERLLRRVFDFSDIHVEAIMKPRVDVDAIEVTTPLGELLKMIGDQHHSRYPVYRESVDNIVGVLYTKDLFDMVIRQPELLTNPEAHFNLMSIVRNPLFIPGTLTVDKLLEKMQKTKIHLAIVIDEYGGTAGVVTMEDILEQLIGEVQDEYDLETSPITSEGNSAIVSGLLSLGEVEERFGDLDEEPLSTTIGGYVAELLSRIPVAGDKVRFGDYDVLVEEMDGLRVEKVRFVRRVPEDETTSE
jgi:magnesium and cobalt exporter, CNNM family